MRIMTENVRIPIKDKTTIVFSILSNNEPNEINLNFLISRIIGTNIERVNKP